jgi:hypothetical protein
LLLFEWRLRSGSDGLFGHVGESAGSERAQDVPFGCVGGEDDDLGLGFRLADLEGCFESIALSTQQRDAADRAAQVGLDGLMPWSETEHRCEQH